MPTLSNAQAVKSLNEASGRKRFVFKSFPQRLEDIQIDVYRNLHPIKSEPSEGSSFFLDCLVQWRELNTAEDFISFYEEMIPFVQTLPLVLLHKELILSKLLSRIQMKSRLSLEPILRLIAALSRDLLEEFLPFLPRITDSLASLLGRGADRESEIIEQIFTFWSYIMMYLQKYLMRDVVLVLKVTQKLRYYSKDYVQEFMAEVMSFLLRNAPVEQLIKGIQKIMSEIVKKPLLATSYAVSALLFHVMKGASSRFHSRAEQVMLLLMDDSTFSISDKFARGSDTIVEVVIAAFQRLCMELEPTELKLMWNSLYYEITVCFTDGNLLHLRRLLTLLISIVKVNSRRKFLDNHPLLELVGQLVCKFITPSDAVKPEDYASEIVDGILQLMLCIVDVLHHSNDMAAIKASSLQWAPAFNLRNSSLLGFIKELIRKEHDILHSFRINILSALDALVETSEEEVTYLMLLLYERLQVGVQGSIIKFLPEDGLPKITNLLQMTVRNWIAVINDATHQDLSSSSVDQAKLSLLWATISYSSMLDFQGSSLLLMDLVDSIDQLLRIESVCILGFPKETWQGLIGVSLSSYQKLCSDRKPEHDETSKFLYYAKRYRSSSHVLSAVADYLDSMHGLPCKSEASGRTFHLDLRAEKAVEEISLFAENLCQSDTETCISTLRLLSHYEPLVDPENHQPVEKKRKSEVHDGQMSIESVNVIQLLLSIKTTPLSVSTSRKVVLMISRIQMCLSAGCLHEAYIPLVLNGIIGMFYIRFSYIWSYSLDCLEVLIRKHVGFVWDKFVCCLEKCQLTFITSQRQDDREVGRSLSHPFGLVERFNAFMAPVSDNTSHTAVLSLLLQSLQKIPDVAEAHSGDIMPLFLEFLGYGRNNFSSVGLFNLDIYKGKEWKGVLKEWLNLLSMMRSPKSMYCNLFVKDVLQHRLLDESDADIQMKVLNCLLLWKDEFLLQYSQHLKNLISSQCLREEVTTWSLSKESNVIDVHHRANLVPLVIRLLVPKIRKLKTLASRKHASVQVRKAVLGLISQLDIDELSLFFAMLLKPLQTFPLESDIASIIWSFPKSYLEKRETFDFLKYFTVDSVTALPWKKRYGFLHIIDDILSVFDELRVQPFLDLLMGCANRILESCTSDLDKMKNCGFSPLANQSSANPIPHKNDGARADQPMKTMGVHHLKDLRSLCLKIISNVLNKYEDHDFGYEFWGLFFKSVRHLINGFKQEGSSSEKPSSLFCCFIAMSRSGKLIQLLHNEKNLIPDIISMLTVKTASEAIVSSVLEFIENLLNLNIDLKDDSNSIEPIILSNLEALICSLHCFFHGIDMTRKKLARFYGERELRIFKLLSKYIREPSYGRMLIDILLPFLEKRNQSYDTSVEAVKVMKEIMPILGRETVPLILGAVCPLVINGDLEMRSSICDLLDGLAAIDSSLNLVDKLVRELNATSATEIGELDYDTIVTAYEKIGKEFFCSIQEDHASLVLAHFVHDMSSEDIILRHSAYRAFVSFVEFAAIVFQTEVGNQQSIPGAVVTGIDGKWTVACIQRIINRFILKHLAHAMKRGASVGKEWIDLLKEMVLKLTEMPNLSFLKPLCSEDAEIDFFNNITHLQMHRRARALLRFRNFVNAGNFSAGITNKVFVPLFFNMLLDVQDGKGENVKNACLEALASTSGRIEWKSYYALLIRCFREMKNKPDKQKLLLRLVCFILDNFHFSEAKVSKEADDHKHDSSPFMIGDCSLYMPRKDTSLVDITIIQTRLHKTVLPKIQKMLNSDSEKVNVSISLAVLKLLKLLPGDLLETQLPSIIHRISNFLKSKLESIRDDARSALAACLKELGLDYLQLVVRVLKSTLKRGYELHVLGYTINFILSKSLPYCLGGKLDYCLGDLLSVVENDLLGGVAEEKEVEKIASKMKETRKQMSLETLKLIAQNVTFKPHALKLISPITMHMERHLTPEIKSKLEIMLHHVARGIECNPSVDQDALFIFIYGLIEDGIADELRQGEKLLAVRTAKQGKSSTSSEGILPSSINNSRSQCYHLITVFALGLLHNRIKNLKLDRKEELLSMLDPFVVLLTNCLSSRYEDVLFASIRCLTSLIRFSLPSLESQADKIKVALLDIAQGSASNSSPVMQSCLKTLTVLLRNTSITLSSEQLHLLIRSPLFVDIERHPSSIALSLLKAIINRKLVVPEIYDVATRVSELMVTSHLEPIRKKCSQILLQFLLDYRLSEKRLQQHLDFLLTNLRYEHSTGREAVLEMLHAIIIKFPKSILDEQSRTFFVCLVVCLANDQDNKVRSMTGAALKLLIAHVSPQSLHYILEYSLFWYSGGKPLLWGPAAQVLGLLVEVMKKGFRNHIDGVLPVARRILQSAVKVISSNELELSNEAVVPFWKEAYYSLILLEKIFQQLRHLCLERDVEDLWEAICEFLLHPHLWVRNISVRLVSLYFASVTESRREDQEKPLSAFYLMRPDRLFSIAASLCCHLKTQIEDDAAGSRVSQNLTFAICGAHALIGRGERADPRAFWSTLDRREQATFLKASRLLDSKNGKSVCTCLVSGAYSENDLERRGKDVGYLIVSNLVKRMGKIALQMEDNQMKIVFNTFRMISSQIGKDGVQLYASHLLLPLYKVCEGFAGRVISDEVRNLAQEVSGSIRDVMGSQSFVQVYSEIRKNLKAKRDKRKQEDKLMAVVNPVRNAKRKLKVASKHRAHKKRKMATMKMSRWMR